jgi:TPP-dependent pyruvate/acetoin dehydrogenase alpha subunit
MTTSGPMARFEAMALMRAFEDACIKGAMSREIHGEIHIGTGQEAIAAGMVGTLRKEDALVSTHRNHCHGIAKGTPLYPLLAEIFEKETGLCKGRGGHMHPFDPDNNFSATGIVGASIPVALGYAYAFHLERSDKVAIGVTGDGGSNAGNFYECLNIAASWKLPLVILVENNSYGISVRFDGVSATQSVVERAAPFGVWMGTVDGTDVEAVAAAFAEAVQYSRQGKGPAVLEASCIRFRGHYEGDHDGYRDRNDLKVARNEADPLTRAMREFPEKGLATAQGLESVRKAAQKRIQQIVQQVRSDPMPDPSELTKYRFVGE